jgi:adenylate cyclase
VAVQSEFQQRLDSERTANIRDVISVASHSLSIPLYLAFWGADLLYSPENKWEFLFLRLLIIPICIATRAWIKKSNSLNSIQVIASIYTAANSAIITYMIFSTAGPSSIYYAGLNLVGLGMGTFIPWSSTYWRINVATVYGPYLVGSVFLAIRRSEQLSPIILNFFFIAGTLIMIAVIRHYAELLRRKELDSRIELESELQQRARTIDEKTQQALSLASLAKQFSPQVIQAIASGALNIHKGIHRSKICAIFIDIVNSTDRIVRIDKDPLNTVLSMFMEDTMPILLKYDITIDKFLGDGVLAFSNDPVQYSDFIERVANAAIEIRQRIKSRDDEYIEHWLDHFQVRIGIASGFANVGFYGNESYLKSYTAIGPVMNLASRLCSSAAPDQILVSKDIESSLSHSNFITKSLGTQRLKGFELDLIKTFELVGTTEKQLGDSRIESCPQGHGILHIDTSPEGIYFLKCRVCSFTQDKKSNKLAS